MFINDIGDLIKMTLWTPEFERDLIKAIIGLVILIVGAQLISAGGFIASGNIEIGRYAFIPVTIVLFVVGGILIYFSIIVLLSLLRSMGVRIWEGK